MAFDDRQWKDFVGRDLDISGRLAVPELESLHVQAILQFSNGTVGLGECQIAIPVAASGPKLTSLLLSDRIEPAQGPPDPSNPLRGENFRLYLPAQSHFSSADKLTLYYGILDVPLNGSMHPPRLRASYAVKVGSTVVMRLPDQEIRPSGTPDRVLVLKQIDPKALQPGSYTLEVTVEDVARASSSAQSANFVIR